MQQKKRLQFKKITILKLNFTTGNFLMGGSKGDDPPSTKPGSCSTPTKVKDACRSGSCGITIFC